MKHLSSISLLISWSLKILSPPCIQAYSFVLNNPDKTEQICNFDFFSQIWLRVDEKWDFHQNQYGAFFSEIRNQNNCKNGWFFKLLIKNYTASYTA